jgi:hypothetical protein
MSSKPGVTLQINLAPTDLPHAEHILPHQLRQLAGQVDEIVLVVDLHQSRGRFGEGWHERLPGLQRLIGECCAEYGHAHVAEVDYSQAVADELARRYFGGKPVPAKDRNGGPFYSYFFGLYAAGHDYVLHTDSDVMYGGGSQTWIAEAVELLTDRDDVLACSPLPGPPTRDGHLTSQILEREPLRSLAYRAGGLSSRVFMMHLPRFHQRIGELPLARLSPRRHWQAVFDGNPPFDLPECIWSQAMADHGLLRIDFLGDAEGMWSIHPPYRSPLFYERLPSLIHDVEVDNLPEAQRGDHDVNDSVIDWTSARMSLWQRLVKHERLLVQTVSDKVRPGVSRGMHEVALPSDAPARPSLTGD